jgi:hypothetical protein
VRENFFLNSFLSSPIDVRQVPEELLPLQTTLKFEAPPVSVIASYLQLLGLANDRHISLETAEKIVSSTKHRPISADVPDHPVHPLSFYPAPSVDLRRSINELQFVTRSCSISAHNYESYEELRTMFVDGWKELEETLCDWSTLMESDKNSKALGDPEGMDRLSQFLDLVSIADSHINRRPEWILEVSPRLITCFDGMELTDFVDQALAIDRYEETPDDEVVVDRLLQKPEIEMGVGQAFYNRDEEMALAGVVLGREWLKVPRVEQGKVGGWFEGQRLFDARAKFQEGIVHALDEVISLGTPLLPRAATVEEYLGYVQKMVMIDDTLAHMETRVGRRAIRQSSRLVSKARVYERWVGLSDDNLHAVRVSGLGMD